MGYWRLAAHAGLTVGIGSEGGCGGGAHCVCGGGAPRLRCLVAWCVTVATAVAARNAKERTKVALRPPRCCVCDRVRIAMGSVSATLGGCAPSGRYWVRWVIGCGSAGTGLAAPGAESTLGTGATLGTDAGGVFACRGATLGVDVGGRRCSRHWSGVLLVVRPLSCRRRCWCRLEGHCCGGRRGPPAKGVP